MCACSCRGLTLWLLHPSVKWIKPPASQTAVCIWWILFSMVLLYCSIWGNIIRVQQRHFEPISVTEVTHLPSTELSQPPKQNTLSGRVPGLLLVLNYAWKVFCQGDFQQFNSSDCLVPMPRTFPTISLQGLLPPKPMLFPYKYPNEKYCSGASLMGNRGISKAKLRAGRV